MMAGPETSLTRAVVSSDWDSTSTARFLARRTATNAVPATRAITPTMAPTPCGELTDRSIQNTKTKTREHD